MSVEGFIAKLERDRKLIAEEREKVTGGRKAWATRRLRFIDAAIIKARQDRTRTP